MENIKVNFAHICDTAFLSQGGKVNIIGIFQTILSKQFPVSHPKFSVIVSLNVENQIGPHKETVKIIREEDKRVIEPVLNVEFNVSAKTQELNFIGDVINARFEKAGRYTVKIFFDDQEIFSIPMDMVQPPK